MPRPALVELSRSPAGRAATDKARRCLAGKAARDARCDLPTCAGVSRGWEGEKGTLSVSGSVTCSDHEAVAYSARERRETMRHMADLRRRPAAAEDTLVEAQAARKRKAEPMTWPEITHAGSLLRVAAVSTPF